MSITGELKSRIDKLWTEFWTGGITNPLTVIEQITYLIFIRLLDLRESREEKKAQRTGKEFHRLYGDEDQHLRWSHFRNMPAEKMLETMRDKVFPHFKSEAVAGRRFAEFMQHAQFLIQKPTLLVNAVNMIQDLPLGEADTKGDLYEYLLSKLTTAGVNGQFRTPRHVIEMMVEIVDPEADETVADPACGTGGFLVRVREYLQRKYTSEEMIEEVPTEDGKKELVYAGDLLEPHREHIQKRMFTGFEFDSTMLRIASMNMLLHGVDESNIQYQDTLSSKFEEKFPRHSADCFDVVLANPPFKGSLDYEDVADDLLAEVKTKKTELLFLVLILRMLKMGGRSATVVPDGVLFGSSRAHKTLREKLLNENQLEAVISLPSGVFKPYAGVSTAVIVFTKGGSTDRVLFYNVEADGYSLDDKRQEIKDNDLPDVVDKWKAYRALSQADLKKLDDAIAEQADQPVTGKKDKPDIPFLDRTHKAFVVTADEIRDNAFDLSINRYKEVEYEAVEYDPPKMIIARLQEMEKEIQQGLAELEEMLG